MRLALLSDIHGNPIALDAVLADVEAQGGVDEYWVLGDIAALGYDPIGALERVTALPNVRFTRGNTDRYTVTGDRPPPTKEEVERNPQLLAKFQEVSHSFAWTQGYVTAGGWLVWLADLPLEQRLTLPDGTRLLGVHASPGRDDGGGILPTMSDDEIGALIRGCEADLVCVGHTHQALERTVGGVRVINLGSVSNPATTDYRASYVVLEADPAGYRLEWRRVPYDWQTVVDRVRQVQHPGARFICHHWLRSG